MRRFLLFLVVAGTLFGLAACGGGGGGGTKTAQIRFGNFVRDASSGVEVLIDTKSVGTLNYGIVSTYVTQDSGSRSLVYRDSASSVDFITQSQTLVADTSYTFVGMGAVVDGTGSLYTDDKTAPATGNFKIRVINATPIGGGGAFDVYITAPGVDLFSVAPNATNVNYRSATSYMSLAKGTYQISLTRPGTATNGRFYFGGSVEFKEGSIYTLIVSSRTNNVVHVVTVTD